MKRPFNLFHRANLNLRTNANVERKFGNLTTWNTPFQNLMKNVLFEINTLTWDNGKINQVLASKNVKDINGKYDLVYLDPPYISKNGNSDNYLKRYHFLEGLTDYDNWEKGINNNTKIKFYESNLVNKDWEDKNKFEQNLFNLIKKHKNSIVVLSYMSNTIPTVTDLSKFFEKHFAKVTVSTYNLNHALVKNRRTEILIIGEP